MKPCFWGKVLMGFSVNVVTRSSSMLLVTTARSMGLRSSCTSRLCRMTSFTFVGHGNHWTQVFRDSFTIARQHFLSSLMSTIGLTRNQVTLLGPTSGMRSVRLCLFNFGCLNSGWVCSRVAVKVSKWVLLVTASSRCRLSHLWSASHRSTALLTCFSCLLLQ